MLRSLAILSCMRVCRANKEWDEAREAFAKMYVTKGKKKKKKIAKLCQELAILQGNLAKSREGSGQHLLKVKLLEEKWDNLREAIDQRVAELEELWEPCHRLQA